jgi:MFS family permease
MTVVTFATATSAENRKAVVAGTIGNVLEWYDFGVYGYFATTMSQLFFPGDDKTISLLKAFAVFGVGFVMRPVGSILFGIYGDRFGRRLALSAVIFLMAFSTVAIGLLPTYAQAGVLAPILLVIFRLLQGLSAGGEQMLQSDLSTSYFIDQTLVRPRTAIPPGALSHPSRPPYPSLQ